MRAQGWNTPISLRFLVIFFVLGLPQTMSAQVKAAIPEANTPAQATQQDPKPADDRVIINTDLISFNVTITDQYGRFVTGLQKNAFTVLDDKQPQEITFFSDDASRTHEPSLTVGLAPRLSPINFDCRGRWSRRD